MRFEALVDTNAGPDDDPEPGAGRRADRRAIAGAPARDRAPPGPVGRAAQRQIEPNQAGVLKVDLTTTQPSPLATADSQPAVISAKTLRTYRASIDGLRRRTSGDQDRGEERSDRDVHGRETSLGDSTRCPGPIHEARTRFPPARTVRESRDREGQRSARVCRKSRSVPM